MTDDVSASILLVEDDPGDQLIVREALTEAKLANQVRMVPSLVDALAAFDESRTGAGPPPDLVLLDIDARRGDIDALAIVAARNGAWS